MIPKAVVFDWAGTIMDFGSRAPVIALLQLFNAAGVPITEAEICSDMGLQKIDHIRACGSAWKKDPVSGVIGAQKGPLISVV